MARSIVHHELRESMTEVDIEIVIQAALEKHPGVKPRIISDNGPQYIAKDFKAFVRFNGLTHVTTSPYYPQSNGKQERFYGTLKAECIRPNPPRDYDEAVKQIAAYVRHYNEVRLHSGIGYITPADTSRQRIASTVYPTRSMQIVTVSLRKLVHAVASRHHLQLQADVRD